MENKYLAFVDDFRTAMVLAGCFCQQDRPAYVLMLVQTDGEAKITYMVAREDEFFEPVSNRIIRRFKIEVEDVDGLGPT